MRDIECPFCNAEFRVEEWEDGECPICREEYYWDECCTEDYSDCWGYIIWKSLNEI